MDNRIYRSRETKMLAGVCGGIADMFNIDPTLVRLVAVALTIFSGFTFLLVYFMCAIIIPLEPSPGYLRNRNQQATARTQAEPMKESTAAPQEMPQTAPVTDTEQSVANSDKPMTADIQAPPERITEETTRFNNDDTVINTKADKY